MSSSRSTLKAFAELHDDYAFFERHVDETEATLSAWLPLVQKRPSAPKALDFGAGSGSFTATFLARAQFGADLLLTIVEPDEGFREAALRRLQPYSAHPIEAWPLLERDLPPSFDLIFSHHVLYYVPNLQETLRRLSEALLPGGRLLIVQGGDGNGMNLIVFAAFRLLGIPSPYHYSEDTQACFESLGIPVEVQQVRSVLDFPDSTENRRRILRFLLGEHLLKLPEEAVLALFDPFARRGRIAIESSDELFLVSRTTESL